ALRLAPRGTQGDPACPAFGEQDEDRLLEPCLWTRSHTLVAPALTAPAGRRGQSPPVRPRRRRRSVEVADARGVRSLARPERARQLVVAVRLLFAALLLQAAAERIVG